MACRSGMGHISLSLSPATVRRESHTLAFLLELRGLNEEGIVYSQRAHVPANASCKKGKERHPSNLELEAQIELKGHLNPPLISRCDTPMLNAALCTTAII